MVESHGILKPEDCSCSPGPAGPGDPKVAFKGLF